ncbi:MAG: hypothetical protein ACLTBX_01580 [Clostridia bacterium]
MDNWQYHNGKMKELKQLYLKTSKQTQNRLQEIIDIFKFSFDTLYNVTDNKTKNRVNTYIEEWKDRGILTGYFGILAKNIYNRTRVKNSEILELLIYSAYIEEQAKIKEQELNIMYDDVNYYYQEGQQEVNNTLSKKERKPINTLEWALFLSLLDTPNTKGYIFEQYIQATIQFNTQQIYRQMTIDLQQQKQSDITNDIYQNLIKRQNNSKLNINGDKISGDIDAQLIGLNNLAKVEGIKEVDSEAQVRFIATIDGNETDMCHSLDGKLFYINKENEFNRYYGETQKDLKIEKIKCKGLVLGLNLPPISHHFHWCRSTIVYQAPKTSTKVEQEEKYNLFDKAYERRIEKLNLEQLNIRHIDKKTLSDILKNMKKVYKDFPQIEGKIKEINEIRHPYGGMNITPQEDGTYIMEINRNIFNDKVKAKEMYNKDLKRKFHPKNSSYKDMGIHEAGHMVLNEILRKKYSNINALATDWNNNITSTRILNQALKKCKINGIISRRKAIMNISNYAIEKDASETIAEAFVDYYVNKNKSTNLSKAIVTIMKGMI